MTEKKKRGRPKGSEKQKSNWTPEQENTFKQDFEEKGYATAPNTGLFCTNADKFKPLPDNYFSMSKTEKLAWLTENRR